MDDLYAVGEASVVFQAMATHDEERFKATGVVATVSKQQCFARETDWDACEERPPEMPCSNDGIVVGGIPIGTSQFIKDHLEEIKDQIIEQATTTFNKFKFSRHYNWAMLYYSTRTRADYWLRHVYPSLTEQFAEDLQVFFEQLFFNIMEINPEAFLEKDMRMQLPLRLSGVVDGTSVSGTR